MKAPTAVVEVLLPLRNKTSQQVEDFLKNELQRKGKGSLPVNKSVGGFSAPFLISTPHDITPMDFQASKRSHKKTQTPNIQEMQDNQHAYSVSTHTDRCSFTLHPLCLPHTFQISDWKPMEDTACMKLVYNIARKFA